METPNWRTIQTSASTVEVLPDSDVIEHKKKFTCPCNPKVEARVDDYGVVWWITTHNSFDEFLDEDQQEPYKGL